MAATYAHLNDLMTYAATHGFDEKLIGEYCSLWMHSDQKVFYQKSEGTVINPDKLEGVVKSVDNEGFLLVENANRQLIRLHPDGNSFDLTHKLIYPVRSKPT